MSDPRLSVSVEITGTLYTIARIYDIGNQILRLQAPTAKRAVEYAPRMWADLHVEALGWGLLLAVFAAALLLAWPR